MSQTAEEIVVLEDLDFAPPCECPMHGIKGSTSEPARWIVWWAKFCTHTMPSSQICDPCWKWINSDPDGLVQCYACGRRTTIFDVVIRVEAL